MNWSDYEPFLLALALGSLVGLQREWRGSDIAGIRTFPIFTLMGALAGVLTVGEPGWLAGAGLLAVAILLVIANLAKIRQADDDAVGMTTEAAALLMYVVGVGLGCGLTGPAIVTAGVTAVLLHWKERMHGFVEKIGEKDFRGLMHLVLIGLVILPLLPDETYGPYDVLNPRGIWMMVVLIVGISMAAYVAYKILGAGVGAVLGGVLGGLISSTATTVSYARQTKQAPEMSSVAALVVLIASTIVNVRVLVEVGVVAPKLLAAAALPILILLGVMAVECLILYFVFRKQDTDLPEHENPAQLKPAVIFAGLYALILLVVAWARDQFGPQALYGIAVVSGLTDVDAITLSTAKLFNEGRVSSEVAWRVVLIATLANLVFKGLAVAFLGSRKLLLYVAVTFGVALICGILLLLTWPEIEIAVPGEMFGNPREQTDQ